MMPASPHPNARVPTAVDRAADAYFDAVVAASPMTATHLGIARHQDEIDDLSLDGLREQSTVLVSIGACATSIRCVGDYFWHLVLPLTAIALASVTTTAFLTKNSFLDEIRKQYVTTARMKGLSERKVLYGHVFRNAMLIVIAGFPGAFISAFFAGSLLIETIFSLDGLGLLGVESVLNRDYPVVFGTLYTFGLMGLFIGIISDLTYVLVDPRIDFEKRAG